MPVKKKKLTKTSRKTTFTGTIKPDKTQQKALKTIVTRNFCRQCLYQGKIMTRWDAALNFLLESLYDPDKKPLTVTKAIRECTDDHGQKVFPLSVAMHNQRILTQMLNAWMGQDIVPTRNEVNYLLLGWLEEDAKTLDEKLSIIDRYIKINGLEPNKVFKGKVEDEEIRIEELSEPAKLIRAISQIEKEKNGESGTVLKNRVRDFVV